MTKEKTTMKAMAPNDNVMMAEMVVWHKNLLMEEMFVVAEAMTVKMTATKFSMQAVATKRRMKTARLAEATSDVAWLRAAKVPGSS
jgi:hypothetical protein